MQWHISTNATTKILKVFLLTPQFHKKLHFDVIKLLVTEIVKKSVFLYTLFCCEVWSYEFKYSDTISDSFASVLPVCFQSGYLFTLTYNHCSLLLDIA